MPVEIQAQNTPNPNAMKFTLNRALTSGTSRTYRAGQPADDALAAALLAIPDVAQVFFLNDFISVTRTPEGDWAAIQAATESAIQSHFASAPTA